MRVLTLLLVLLLVCDAAAFVRRGDVVVTQPKGLVRLDPATGVTIAIPIGKRLVHPTGIVVLPDGDLLIADWDLPHMDEGSVVRVRPLDGVVRFVAQSPDTVNPFSLARAPDGHFVLGDIDAGTKVQFPKTVLRRGVLFDFDPDTGERVSRVADCCEFNPVDIAFASPTQIAVADAGCCAYMDYGQVAIADTVSGRYTVIPWSKKMRDPFAVAVSPDGGTLYVTESSVVQPGPPGVYAFDLNGGLPAVIAQGLPMVHPTGLATEDDGRLLVADAGAGGVLRVDPPTGAVDVIAAGRPFDEPAKLVLVDVGDVVSGVTPKGPEVRACAERTASASARLGARTLRCIGEPDPIRCLAELRGHWPPEEPPGPDCPACMPSNLWRQMPVVPEALLRTPGQLLSCGGTQPDQRRPLTQAAARLYTRRSRCDGTFLVDGDRPRLERCQRGADAAFLRTVRGRCDAATLHQIAAQLASVADATIGLSYCTP